MELTTDDIYYMPGHDRTDAEWDAEHARRARFHELEGELFGQAAEPDVFGNGDIRTIKLPYEDINILVNLVVSQADHLEATAQGYARLAEEQPHKFGQLYSDLTDRAKGVRRIADKLIESRVIWKD